MTSTNLHILAKENKQLWCVVFKTSADIDAADNLQPQGIRLCYAKWSGSKPIIDEYKLQNPCILKFEDGEMIGVDYLV